MGKLKIIVQRETRNERKRRNEIIRQARKRMGRSVDRIHFEVVSFTRRWWQEDMVVGEELTNVRWFTLINERASTKETVGGVV